MLFLGAKSMMQTGAFYVWPSSTATGKKISEVDQLVWISVVMQERGLGRRHKSGSLVEEVIEPVGVSTGLTHRKLSLSKKQM
jgi:hypothetical protein